MCLHIYCRLRFTLNTRECAGVSVKLAIGACTTVYDTDLQRGRAVTSMFRDVTIEIYARFQSLGPLSIIYAGDEARLHVSYGACACVLTLSHILSHFERP